jgi:hypothetical protein
MSSSLCDPVCNDYAIWQILAVQWNLVGFLMINVYEGWRQFDGSKCFTYVTKTIANSTTYSRKSGDYNGTIIFEFDVILTLFKIHIFCHCENQNNTSFLLDSQHSQLSF